MKFLSQRFLLTLSLVALGLGLFLFSETDILVAGNIARQSPPSSPASIKAGEAIFFEYCSGCHGRRADGRGPQALNLVPKPQNMRNAQFVKYLTDERMFSSISGGVRGTAMQAFEMILTPEKRWNVIHYIRSLTADDTLQIPNAIAHLDVDPKTNNPVASTQTSIESGKKLFRNYCANCHGANANGNGVIAQNLIPRPRNLVAISSWGEKPFIDYLSDARLFDSITNGVPGTSMLPWIGVMTDEERWHIINFLRATAQDELKKSSQ
ncbi:MAG: c-type cytochrome [Bacteroidetes bacterium]|nr:MAG: c-type cytochrome [Bacteroidota bacterium]